MKLIVDRKPRSTWSWKKTESSARPDSHNSKQEVTKLALEEYTQEDLHHLQHQRNHHHRSSSSYVCQPRQQKSNLFDAHYPWRNARLLFLFLSDGLPSLSLARRQCPCPYFPCLDPLTSEIRIVVDSSSQSSKDCHLFHIHPRHHFATTTYSPNTPQSQPGILLPIFLILSSLKYILFSIFVLLL
jgi:hypothetical protein